MATDIVTRSPMFRASSWPTIATTDGEKVYASTGETFTISHRPGGMMPAGLLAEACSRHGIAQLWVHSGMRLDLDFGWADTWDFRASAEGWIHGIKKGTDYEADLVVPGVQSDSPWLGAPDAPALLNGLRLYRDLVGITFHHSPNSTSKDLLVSLHTGHRRSIPLKVVDQPPPALRNVTEVPLGWIRRIAEGEPAALIQSYDKNCAYLGVCSSLPLGAGPYEHIKSGTTLADKDMALPGYFLVSTQPNDIPIPSMLPDKRQEEEHPGWQWVTTPTLALLVERHQLVMVAEAYVWREHPEPLTPWYKRLRDARAALMASAEGYSAPGAREALAAVKASYSAFAGGYLCAQKEGWDRSDDVLFRPDIRHQIIAAARSNLVRKALRCIREDGVTPLALGAVDTIYILTDDPDPVAACPPCITLGSEVRDWKANPTITVTPALRALLDADTPDHKRLSMLAGLLIAAKRAAAAKGPRQ